MVFILFSEFFGIFSTCHCAVESKVLNMFNFLPVFGILTTLLYLSAYLVSFLEKLYRNSALLALSKASIPFAEPNLVDMIFHVFGFFRTFVIFRDILRYVIGFSDSEPRIGRLVALSQFQRIFRFLATFSARI